jgi:hypothetical protein
MAWPSVGYRQPVAGAFLTSFRAKLRAPTFALINYAEHADKITIHCLASGL